MILFFTKTFCDFQEINTNIIQEGSDMFLITGSHPSSRRDHALPGFAKKCANLLVEIAVISWVSVASPSGCHAQQSNHGMEIESQSYSSPDVVPRLTVFAGSQSLQFILDTGFSENVLDLSNHALAGEWQREAIAKGLTRSYVGNIHAAPLLTFGNSAIKHGERTLLTDIAFISDLLGQRIDGIFGVPFFRNYVIEINATKRSIYVYHNDKQPNGQLLLELIPDSLGVPAVGGIFIDGKECRFVLDTGYNGGLALNSSLFEQLARGGLISEISYKHINDSTRIRSGKLRSANIWGCKFTNVPASESKDNLVGMAVVSKFDVVIALAAKQFAATPSVSWDAPFRYDRSGLHLIASGNRIIVFSVRENSPLGRAGVQSGDCLVKANQKSLWRNDISDLRSTFSDPAIDSLTLEIIRDGVTIEIEAKLD